MTVPATGSERLIGQLAQAATLMGAGIRHAGWWLAWQTGSEPASRSPRAAHVRISEAGEVSGGRRRLTRNVGEPY
jgi:hypothetical protein